MRANRKKRFALRRENRAREFWKREVAPALDRARERAFREGVEHGRGLEREAMSLIVPMKEEARSAYSSDVINLDRLEFERMVHDRDFRPRREIKIRIRHLDHALSFDPNALVDSVVAVEDVRFERVMWGVEINGVRVRWATWQLEARHQREQPKPIAADFLSAMFEFIREIPRYTNDYAVRSRAEMFSQWAKSRGIETEPFRVPSRAIPGREEEHTMIKGWSNQGAWR